MSERVWVDNHLPTLVVHHPTCSHCGQDVTIEDGAASCETCLIQWDGCDEDSQAEPDPNIEGTDDVCGKPGPEPERSYVHDGKRYELDAYLPCILPAGHGGECLHPYSFTTTPQESS